MLDRQKRVSCRLDTGILDLHSAAVTEMTISNTHREDCHNMNERSRSSHIHRKTPLRHLRRHNRHGHHKQQTAQYTSLAIRWCICIDHYCTGQFVPEAIRRDQAPSRHDCIAIRQNCRCAYEHVRALTDRGSRACRHTPTSMKYTCPTTRSGTDAPHNRCVPKDNCARHHQTDNPRNHRKWPFCECTARADTETCR
jgi:hypothetical protein